MGVGANNSSSSGSSQGTSNFSSSPSDQQSPWYSSFLRQAAATGLYNPLYNPNPALAFGTAGGAISPYTNPWGSFANVGTNPLVAPVTGDQSNALGAVNAWAPASQWTDPNS